MSDNKSNVACYFKNDSGSKWEWALVAGSNDYYEITGQWETGAETGVERFVADGSVTTDDVNVAVKTAQNYYELTGYELVGVFAAVSSTGRNYPLVVQGQVMSPTG